MEGWPGGGRAQPLSPCCHCAAEVLCLSTHVSLCFPTGVKRGHCTSEMSCQRSPHVSPHISLKQDSLCPLPPPLLSFFLLSLIIFQLEVGQELVLSLRASLLIYKLIDAGEYNAQATDVITALIKTITAAHGCHSWGGRECHPLAASPSLHIWMYFCSQSIAWVCNTAFIQMMLPASVHMHTYV